MGRLYPGLTADAIRAREAALSRYEAFAPTAPVTMSPAEALAAVGLLYDLLPPESRERAVDPDGLAALHRALAALGARR
jgi:hypothetical protein